VVNLDIQLYLRRKEPQVHTVQTVGSSPKDGLNAVAKRKIVCPYREPSTVIQPVALPLHPGENEIFSASKS